MAISRARIRPSPLCSLPICFFSLKLKKLHLFPSISSLSVSQHCHHCQATPNSSFLLLPHCFSLHHFAFLSSVASGCSWAFPLCYCRRPATSPATNNNFGLQNQQHRLPLLLWFSSSSATLLNSFFPRSIAVAASIGS